MKTKIFILSALLCAIGYTGAGASDYTNNDCCGAGETECECNAGQENDAATESYDFDDSVGMLDDMEISNTGGTCSGGICPPGLTRMHNVKLLSIKPAPIDNRPPLWDGVHGEYKQRLSPKTVSWKNGIPIWDDSISNYRKKDFHDWMLDSLPELYLREPDDPELVGLYNETMNDANATRARIEELLAPTCPCENSCGKSYSNPCSDMCGCKSQYKAAHAMQKMAAPAKPTFNDDGCPFETETECNIWRRKPIIREIVSPRSPKIRDSKMVEFLSSARCNGNINANSAAAAPLVARYKMLMDAAQACCTEGMVYSLRQAGASDGLVYKFMSDDANFYNISSRCLMTTDAELDVKYPDTATSTIIADVRNGCLCRGRQWFTAMLAPFVDAWNASPEFASSKFLWTYTDGLQRQITVSINDDVRNVLDQLDACP